MVQTDKLRNRLTNKRFRLLQNNIYYNDMNKYALEKFQLKITDA